VYFFVREGARNVRGEDRMYITRANTGFDFIHELLGTDAFLPGTEVALNPENFSGMAGTILPAKDIVNLGE
jgi:hypothetical protein